MDKKTRVQSVSRACMILQLLGVKKNGLSTTEISDHMNLNRSTTHHLISTLQDHNFVKLNADNKYCLSSALHELVNQAPKNTLINIAHGILVDVVNATDETTYFSIFQDGVISLDIILGTGALRVVQAFPLPGEPQNLHARASGKLYLSTLGTKELEKYIEENSLKSLANNTIVNKEELLNELEKIRKQGFSEDYEEFSDGIICYAYPILLKDKIIGCISSSLPSARRNKYSKVRQILQNAAKKFENLIDENLYISILNSA